MGEKLAKLEVVSIFSSLFGVILLTKPELIFSQMKNDVPLQDDYNYTTGIFLSFVGAISGALAYLYCRMIGKTLHPSVHPFYFAITTAIVGTLLMIFTN